MTQSTGITLRIEGREFVQDAPTFEQEMYIMEAVTEAGIEKIPALELTGPDDKPDLEHLARQMLVAAYKSGALFRLLGALVVEKGKEWSRELAEEQAELFRTTRDPESKAQLQPALVGSVLAFFESGVNSGSISPTSSDGLDDIESTPLVDEPKVLTPEQAAEVFRTGSMNSPSSRSPSTTVSIRPKSSTTGKSGTASSRAKGSGAKSRGRSTSKSR